MDMRLRVLRPDGSVIPLPMAEALRERMGLDLREPADGSFGVEIREHEPADLCVVDEED